MPLISRPLNQERDSLTLYLLYARLCPMHFTHLNSFNSRNTPMREESTIVITVLGMRKRRHRGLERLAQGHVGGTLAGRGANLRPAALASVLPPPCSPASAHQRWVDSQGSIWMGVWMPCPHPLGTSWNGGSCDPQGTGSSNSGEKGRG